MDTKHSLSRLVDVAGGQAALARKLSELSGQTLIQSHIGFWLHKSKQGMPAEFCRFAEQISDGRVTRYDLRPDVFGPAPADQGAAA